MSQYLDNDESRDGRINENYGREILELHTVGVNAGYNDDDVIAVSRVFTGWRWSEEDLGEEPESDVQRRHAFLFDAERHDSGDKAIPFLGVTITGRSGDDGAAEGEELIAILAQDENTIRFVCGKLVQRLVSDAMPETYVEACRNAWSSTEGDMRAAVRSIVLHPDLAGDLSALGTKTRTPFEYAVSMARAMGMEPAATDEDALRDFFGRFRRSAWDAGYNSFVFPAPTGLPEVGAAWASSGSLLAGYRPMMEITERLSRSNSDLQQQLVDAGLETPEEVAAYLLALATSDRYQLDEFEAVVAELRGTDGLFELRAEDESQALERAMSIIAVSPSFHLQ